MLCYICINTEEIKLCMANKKKISTTNIDQLLAVIQAEFPTAGIRITGRARTIRHQAELMAQRIRANRREFLRTYVNRRHIKAAGGRHWHVDW